ncbi:GTPase-activating protein, putative [Plasmodium gaboni]|uniref:GTPase-activating protein, putative n=1 Tax=Plasmodium gaboni TaxID=647221 RepID=A0ABY1UJ79_9APIC|nr:GTPase-activating protein, putative [Plasmodium gaboni]
MFNNDIIKEKDNYKQKISALYKNETEDIKAYNHYDMKEEEEEEKISGKKKPSLKIFGSPALHGLNSQLNNNSQTDLYYNFDSFLKRDKENIQDDKLNYSVGRETIEDYTMPTLVESNKSETEEYGKCYLYNKYDIYKSYKNDLIRNDNDLDYKGIMSSSKLKDDNVEDDDNNHTYDNQYDDDYDNKCDYNYDDNYGDDYGDNYDDHYNNQCDYNYDDNYENQCDYNCDDPFEEEKYSTYCDKGYLRSFLKNAIVRPNLQTFLGKKIISFLNEKERDIFSLTCKILFFEVYSLNNLKTLYKYQFISDEKRSFIWKAILLEENTYISEEYYKELKNRKSMYDKTIEKDINRTFPNNPHFINKNMNMQNKLLDILKVCSLYYERIGYCQGMNYIAGILLLVFRKNIDTIRCFISMLKNYNIKGMFSYNFPQLKKIIYQLNILIKAYIPKLFYYFRRKKIKIDFFCVNWFLTLFSQDLSFENTLKLWDLFFLFGIKILMKFTLILLYYHENNIIHLSYDEALTYLKTITKSPFINYLFQENNFFLYLKKFKITNRMLTQIILLKKNHQKINLLVKENNGKLKCSIQIKQNNKHTLTSKIKERFRNFFNFDDTYVDYINYFYRQNGDTNSNKRDDNIKNDNTKNENTKNGNEKNDNEKNGNKNDDDDDADTNNNLSYNHFSNNHFYYRNFFQHFNCGNIFKNPNYSNEIVLTNTTCLSVHFNSNILCNSKNLNNKNTNESLEDIKENDHTKNSSNFFLETNTYYDLNLTKSSDPNNFKK